MTNITLLMKGKTPYGLRCQELQQLVDQFIKQHQLIEPHTVVLVGVSGGPDSMALLNFLYSSQHKWDITLIACCVDHMLRGKESEADLYYVKAFCEERQITFVGKQVNVSDYIAAHHVSTQVACRDLRYEVFKEVMETYNAKVLALAHHGDDQIETMLMREVHGSFGLSRAGIAVKRSFATGNIIRPFLCLTKDQLEKYCEDAGIIPRRDPSNNSDKYVRNRFRHYILPFLKEENPQVHLRFQLESEFLRDDYLFLEELAKTFWDEVVVQKSRETLVLDSDQLLKHPVSLQRRLIHLILSYLYGKEVVYQSVHIQEILFLLRGVHPSGVLYLPKELKVTRSYNRCQFSFIHTILNDSPTFFRHLELPGKIDTPVGQIAAKIYTSSEQIPSLSGKGSLICDFEQIQTPIGIRNRKNGDRISLKGINGTKKVKDIFIDEKVERSQRDIWPLVIDANDDIIWIPELAISSNGTLTKNTSIFLVLTFVR